MKLHYNVNMIISIIELEIIIINVFNFIESVQVYVSITI